MKNITYLLCLLMLTVSLCLATNNSYSASAAPKSGDLSAKKIEKQQYEKQKKELEGELGLWKKDLCNSAVVSAGYSPVGGMSHIEPGQDPTNVSSWRDPITKGDAADLFIKAKSNIERIEDTLEMTKKALIKVEREIKELERIESGGGGGGGGGGSSGGGGGGGY